MAEDFLRGKNLESVAKEIADGYIFVSPIFLKKFNQELVKKMMAAISKTMLMVRNEKYPTGDIEGIKRRNVRLSRLNNALTVIKYFAKERRWVL